MSRGSKPGERRGGRQRGTPNKKTLLRNAEIEAIAGKPDLTPLDYFLAVMRSQHFPLTTRVQAALKALPRLHAKRRADDVDEATFAPNAGSSHPVNEKRSSGSGASIASSDKAVPHRGVRNTVIQEGNKNAELTPLDFLLGLLRSPETRHATRFKVACATAPYIHQKKSTQDVVARAGKPDRYGFAVNLETAKEIRDIVRRIARLKKERPKDPQRYQKNLIRLESRGKAIVGAFVCPCPSLYERNDYANDQKRYAYLLRKRRSRSPLTREENIEEARLVARMSLYAASPENMARARIAELEERDRLNKCGAPPLSIAEQSELRGLKTLFPKVLLPPANFDDMVEWKYPALCELIASERADVARPS
jgi:hypothetical protein